MFLHFRPISCRISECYPSSKTGTWVCMFFAVSSEQNPVQTRTGWIHTGIQTIMNCLKVSSWMNSNIQIQQRTQMSWRSLLPITASGWDVSIFSTFSHYWHWIWPSPQSTCSSCPKRVPRTCNSHRLLLQSTYPRTSFAQNIGWVK